MHARHVTFPVIVGLINEDVDAVPSEQTAKEILALLVQIREHQPGGLLLIHEVHSSDIENIISLARNAGIECRSFVDDISAAVSKGRNSGAETLKLIDASDLLLVLRSRSAKTEEAAADLLKYANAISRPIIDIDSQTGARSGEIPSNFNADTSWLPDVFERAGVSMQDDLAFIRERIDAISENEKPRTTQWWTRLLLVQGVAAVLPLMWLTRRFTGMGSVHAFAILLAVNIMIAIAWWLRWRGMQKLWARTRLVAELGRSILATQRLSIFPAYQLFEIVPALRPLRWCTLPFAQAARDFAEWRNSYIDKRINPQLDYFSEEKQRQLEKQRASLNRWVSLLLDVSLAFAFAGVVTAVFQRFAFTFAGSAMETVFAAAGIISILGLILVQTFSAIERLNLRIAICARQRAMLTRAALRLQNITSRDAAIEIVSETEQQLLHEVLDWYFTTEYAQHFCSIKPAQRRAEGIERPAAPTINIPYANWINAALNRAGGVMAFALRVFVGRIAWAVVAGALVALWLGFTFSNSKLQDFGEFVDRAGNLWTQTYDPNKANQGCVVIIHGMWSEAPDPTAPAQQKYWAREMAEAIETKLASGPSAVGPSVLILDWSLAAAPSRSEGAKLKHDPLASLYDLGAIRRMAYRLGDLAGVQLKDWINENKIAKDRPLHLIGHSAGGYAVARCALFLKRYGVAPVQTHITILDTPVSLRFLGLHPSEKELLKDLPEEFPGAVDFYVTSDLVKLPRDFSAPGLHLYWPPHQSESATKDHQFAYQWFIKTVENENFAPGEGFNRSPLVNKN